MLEEGDGDVFRWVNNDAEIVVTNAGARALELDIAPGPDVRATPLTLNVLDRGEELGRFVIGSRRRIEIGLPQRCETPYTVTLHAQHGGSQKPGNHRIMNFRVSTSRRRDASDGRSRFAPHDR